MVKVSVCMSCKQWKKGWQDRVNPPYNQHYCYSCWAMYMGFPPISSKDTVWLREKWKQDNHVGSRREAKKAQEVGIVAKKAREAAILRADGDNDVKGAWEEESSEEEGPCPRVSHSAIPVGGEQQDDEDDDQDESEGEGGGADSEENRNEAAAGHVRDPHATPEWVQKVMSALFTSTSEGTLAGTVRIQKVLGLLPAGIKKQDLLSRPEFLICGSKANRLCLAEEFLNEPQGAAVESDQPTPAWVNKAVAALWKHGSGNMNYNNFVALIPQGIKKADVLARPEFTFCAKGNKSVRLAGWLRMQR
eukprot:TRINITY_DN25819_c0_g4_i1.p1 TRINITY_DN25819_c0_g4~~TRINITY_DN25819_c0_g4_i1.p1  ORF type:complete len:304 (+),score=37.45 TRINITY_DN25819_c0_g4_i1:81-992(+)